MRAALGLRTFALQNATYMKSIIAIEEAAMFTLAAVAMYYQPFEFKWWIWPLLFLLPDVGMIGYIVSPAVGAFTYNLLHHKAIAILIIITGYLIGNPQLFLSGLILFGHSSFDRMLGYGLKHTDAFKHTHLGWL